MTVTLVPYPKFKATYVSGTAVLPLVGGKLYTYAAGGSTPLVTYSNQGGTNNANPVVLDANGECDVWIDNELAYKFVLKDSLDNTQWTVDNINSPVSSLRTDLADSTSVSKGDALVAVKQPVTGATARTQHGKNQDYYSPLDFGAVGDGTTDDTAAFQLAVTNIPDGMWLDGLGKTYLITTEITSTRNIFKLRNCSFVLGNSYSTQGKFTIASFTTVLKNIDVDGWRNNQTKKTGYEKWGVFGSPIGGRDSIAPTLTHVFSIIKLDTLSTVTIDSVNFYNVHAEQCILVLCYGTVIIRDSEYINVSNKSFHVYHTNDDCVTMYGRTLVSNVYAKSVGILPDTFLIGAVETHFSDSNCPAPQSSFNFIVTGGDYSITNATVDEYGSTAVCADRNTNFECSNVTITNNSILGFSNNPSGALWLEFCTRANVSNVSINIQARDARDTALDSSALQIASRAGSVANFDNIIIIGNDTSAVLKKAVRGSVIGTAAASINNMTVTGKYTSAVEFAPLSTPSTSLVNISNSNISGPTYSVVFYAPGSVVLENVNMVGSFLVDDALSGTVANVTVNNSYIGTSCRINPAVTGNVFITNNKYIGGNVTISKGHGNHYIQNNSNIHGSIDIVSGSATVGKTYITNNWIEGITTVYNSARAVISGNTTQNRIEVKDVGIIMVSVNNAMISLEESAIWINPVTTSNVLGGYITGNNIFINGSGSQAYVTIKSGVGATMVKGTNNEQTFVWI